MERVPSPTRCFIIANNLQLDCNLVCRSKAMQIQVHAEDDGLAEPRAKKNRNERTNDDDNR